MRTQLAALLCLNLNQRNFLALTVRAPTQENPVTMSIKLIVKSQMVLRNPEINHGKITHFSAAMPGRAQVVEKQQIVIMQLMIMAIKDKAVTFMQIRYFPR